MPPKKVVDRAAEQAAREKREKKAADATFGLKNKNKSKVVQKYVQSVTMNANAQPGGKAREAQEAADKRNKAEAQKAALMNSLFSGLPSVKKAEEKAKKEKEERLKKEAEAAAAAKAEHTEEMKRLRRALEKLLREYRTGILLSAIKGMVKAAGDNVGFDLREEDYGYDKLTALFRAPELADVLTLETKDNGLILIRPPGWKKSDQAEDDEIPIEEMVEMQRKALDPSSLTPVTKESFLQWLEMKRLQRAEQAQEASKSKKKGADVVGPTGRELFALNADLFADDADATSDIDYDAREEVEEEGEKADAGDVMDAAVFAEDEELPDDLDE